MLIIATSTRTQQRAESEALPPVRAVPPTTTTAMAFSSSPVARRPLAVSTCALMIMPDSAAVAPTMAKMPHRTWLVAHARRAWRRQVAAHGQDVPPETRVGHDTEQERRPGAPATPASGCPGARAPCSRSGREIDIASAGVDQGQPADDVNMPRWR